MIFLPCYDDTGNKDNEGKAKRPSHSIKHPSGLRKR